MEKLPSPFDDNQIGSLNALQSDARWEPFRCKGCKTALIAVTAGMFCPYCEEIVMTWAWDFMTDWTWVSTLESARRILKRELSRKDKYL